MNWSNWRECTRGEFFFGGGLGASFLSKYSAVVPIPIQPMLDQVTIFPNNRGKKEKHIFWAYKYPAINLLPS